MITIAVAGLYIGLYTNNEYISQNCSRFSTCFPPNFCVSVSDNQIAVERQLGNCTADMAEYTCLYREIAEQLPLYNRFVIHSAAIQSNGLSYLFAAKSGTGKTTHIRLWRERYGDAVKIVNGDKPILWKNAEQWYACGTPWCGKEGLTSTDCVPVGGLCFLERAAENTIRRATTDEIIDRLFHQLYLPKNAAALHQTLTLIDSFLRSTPCWIMGCNMELGAADTAFAAMTSVRKKDI